MHSRGTSQQSFRGYYTVVTYSTVSRCCPGFEESSSNCQGRHTAICACHY